MFPNGLRKGKRGRPKTAYLFEDLREAEESLALASKTLQCKNAHLQKFFLFAEIEENELVKPAHVLGFAQFLSLECEWGKQSVRNYVTSIFQLVTSRGRWHSSVPLIGADTALAYWKGLAIATANRNDAHKATPISETNITDANFNFDELQTCVLWYNSCLRMASMLGVPCLRQKMMVC